MQLNNLSLHNEEGVLHPEREILKDGGHTNAQSNLPLFKYRRKSGLFVWRCNIPLNFKCSQTGCYCRIVSDSFKGGISGPFPCFGILCIRAPAATRSDY